MEIYRTWLCENGTMYIRTEIWFAGYNGELACRVTVEPYV